MPQQRVGYFLQASSALVGTGGEVGGLESVVGVGEDDPGIGAGIGLPGVALNCPNSMRWLAYEKPIVQSE